MASKTKSKGTQLARRAPSVPKKRFEALQQARSRAVAKGREVAAKRVGTLVGAATGYGIGWAEANGKMPARLSSPAAIGGIGAVAALVLPSYIKGRAGAALAEAGAAMLGIATYKLGTGVPAIGEDDTESGDQVQGDWQ